MADDVAFDDPIGVPPYFGNCHEEDHQQTGQACRRDCWTSWRWTAAPTQAV
jgi:hypothetical protein